jgi:hypothetical protein
VVPSLRRAKSDVWRRKQDHFAKQVILGQLFAFSLSQSPRRDPRARNLARSSVNLYFVCMQAQAQGLRSRAAFKLEQINAKHKILRAGEHLQRRETFWIFVTWFACGLPHGLRGQAWQSQT